MSSKFGWAIAAVSAAFNLTFAGGYLHSRAGKQQPPPPPPAKVGQEAEPGPLEALTSHLGLSAQQQREYEQLRAATRERAREIRESLALTRQELMAQLSASPADAAATRELVEMEAEQARQLRMVAAEHFRGLMRILTPEQRQRLMETVRARGGRWFGGPGGKIGRHRPTTEPDGLELRRRLRERWGECGPIRARLIERFDADGDGRLSDQEWQAARRAVDR